jgi:hypothetical protein
VTYAPRDGGGPMGLHRFVGGSVGRWSHRCWSCAASAPAHSQSTFQQAIVALEGDRYAVLGGNVRPGEIGTGKPASAYSYVSGRDLVMLGVRLQQRFGRPVAGTGTATNTATEHCPLSLESGDPNLHPSGTAPLRSSVRSRRSRPPGTRCTAPTWPDRTSRR